MDLEGLCIYSSQVSFVGNNYGFRPYFRDALTHGSGLYAAMGITSKQAGLYYARPVLNGSQPLGVAVIKVKLDFFHLTHLRLSHKPRRLHLWCPLDLLDDVG